MKQKRLYEEARIDVVQLSSKTQLLADSAHPGGPSSTNQVGINSYHSTGEFGSFTETI